MIILCLALLSLSVQTSSAERWQIDFQGDNQHQQVYGQTDPVDATTPGIWNIFEVAALDAPYPGPSSYTTGPISLTLLNDQGDSTPVEFTIDNDTWGWSGSASQESSPLQGDYLLLLNSFGVDSTPCNWSITGLLPNSNYKLVYYHANNGAADRGIDFNANSVLASVTGAAHTVVSVVETDENGIITGTAVKSGSEGNWAGLTVELYIPRAINPTPHNQAENINITGGLTLTWQPGDDNASYVYDLYLGNSPTELVRVAEHQSGTNYNIPNPQWDTTYFWRIDEFDGQHTIIGDLWSFTTKQFACYDLPLADLNRDCRIDLGDMMIMVQQWLGIGAGNLADLNDSGTVDLADADLLAQDWQQQGKQAPNQAVANRLNDPVLYQHGHSRTYIGENLEYISMPIGGIGAGCIQMNGKAQRHSWQIFNNFTQAPMPDSFFAVRAQATDASPVVKALQTESVGPWPGLDSLEFRGEYPFGWYDFNDSQLPVDVALRVFNPMIPLTDKESGIPCAIFTLTAHNPSTVPVEVSFLATQKNAVGYQGQYTGNGPAHGPATGVVYNDFETSDYGTWTVTGTAFGSGPYNGTAPNQQTVSGYQDNQLVNSYAKGGDGPVGTLTSPEFTINHKYIYFLVGGGNHPSETCINLMIAQTVQHSTTGRNEELLRWAMWDVSQFNGQTARIQILDNASGGWGHINIDQIIFSDEYVNPEDLTGLGLNRNSIARNPDSNATILQMTTDKAKDQAGYGDMALITWNDEVDATASWANLDSLKDDFLDDGELTGPVAVGPSADGQTYNGALATPFTLQPGQSRSVTFALTWYFPNVTHGDINYWSTNWKFPGNMYSKWWSSAQDVAHYLSDNLANLTAQTQLYHDSLYQSNLPYYLLDRLSSQASVIHSKTVFRAANGDFGGWEGVSVNRPLGTGTCLHVWHYAQLHARLFPLLGRNLCEQAFRPENQQADGGIHHRLGSSWVPAADGQLGEILNAYRGHLCSTDGTWLAGQWPAIKKAMDYAINTWDSDENGVLAGPQWNTLDGNIGGNTSWIGTLYLAALHASEKMALLQGDSDSANRYSAIHLSGAALQDAILWNPEYGYYIQIPDAAPREDYNTGCNIDQILGTWWAHQLDLEVNYPQDHIETALLSLLKNNYKDNFYGITQAPRKFVDENDAGMMMCTWPNGGRPSPHCRYADEVWTGTEYAAAANMIYNGLLTEGLMLVKTVSDRYDGKLRTGLTDGQWSISGNPFADDEWGTFYARPQSVWSILLACQGFIYDGPAGLIGFNPTFKPENHISFFTAAQGWGVFTQTRAGNTQTETIEIKYGSIHINDLVFELAENYNSNAGHDIMVLLDKQPVPATFTISDQRLQIHLAHTLTVQSDQTLQVSCTYH